MINILQNEDSLTVEILEASGIEDSYALKKELQNALDNNQAVNIIIKDESPLHISLCVVIFVAALEANKKNLVLNVLDNSDILKNTFNNLGLEKEFRDVLQKLKDRG